MAKPSHAAHAAGAVAFAQATGRRGIPPKALWCALLLLAPTAWAQPALAAGQAATATAGAAAQPSAAIALPYVSPLRGYKRYVEQPVGDWREANDRVGRIGGWRAYAREIQRGVAAPASAPGAGPLAAPAAPAPAQAPADPHAGHHSGHPAGSKP